tara:strand:- start:77 stop:328 length:252 start_codon:yes stop_codon:yes gene_type:complete
MKINIDGWGEISVPDDFKKWDVKKQNSYVRKITNNVSKSAGHKKTTEQKVQEYVESTASFTVGGLLLGIIIAILGFIWTIFYK